MVEENQARTVLHQKIAGVWVDVKNPAPEELVGVGVVEEQGDLARGEIPASTSASVSVILTPSASSMTSRRSVVRFSMTSGMNMSSRSESALRSSPVASASRRWANSQSSEPAPATLAPRRVPYIQLGRHCPHNERPSRRRC